MAAWPLYSLAGGSTVCQARDEWPTTNIGVTLDVDVNNMVSAVLPGSAAHKSGVRPGDTIVRAGSTPVLTAADLQFALNSVPDPGSVTLHVVRQGKPLPPMELQLPTGWRRTDISWRACLQSVPPRIGMWGQPLSVDQKRQRGIAADKLALRVTYFSPGPAAAATRGELHMNDVIVGLNDTQLPAMTPAQFHAHCLLHADIGDTLTLTVLRGSQRLDIKVPCTDWSWTTE